MNKQVLKSILLVSIVCTCMQGAQGFNLQLEGILNRTEENIEELRVKLNGKKGKTSSRDDLKSKGLTLKATIDVDNDTGQDITVAAVYLHCSPGKAQFTRSVQTFRLQAERKLLGLMAKKRKEIQLFFYSRKNAYVGKMYDPASITWEEAPAQSPQDIEHKILVALYQFPPQTDKKTVKNMKPEQIAAKAISTHDLVKVPNTFATNPAIALSNMYEQLLYAIEHNKELQTITFHKETENNTPEKK